MRLDGTVARHRPRRRRGRRPGKDVNQGIKVDFLKKLAEGLTPGRAAVIVLIPRTSSRDLPSEIGIPGRVIETSFDEEREQALQRAPDSARED
jgi:uncharacterized membrane protein